MPWQGGDPFHPSGFTLTHQKSRSLFVKCLDLWEANFLLITPGHGQSRPLRASLLFSAGLHRAFELLSEMRTGCFKKAKQTSKDENVVMSYGQK